VHKEQIENGEIGRRVAEDSPLAIYIFQGGKLKFFNDAFIELSGYSRGELSRIDYLALIHPDFRDVIVKQTELALSGATSGLPQEPEVLMLRKNGDLRWVQIRPRIIEYASKSAVLGMAADVTERKHAEELLRKSEMRYRLLVENLSDVIWIVNLDTPKRLEYVSPSVTQLLGYTVEEAMSKRMEEVFTLASLTVMHTLAEGLPATDRGQHNQHEPLTLDLDLIRKDGSKVSVEVKCSVMRGTRAQPASILAVARDITERKALEAERLDIERKAQTASRLAAIGEMAASIAHEINNPLTSVIGFSDLLMRREVPETVRKDLEIIGEGAKRVASIVKRLSVFARQSKPLRRRIDINEIVENAVRLRAYHLRTSGIEVETDLDPDLPETLADGGQLGEVFINIIANAETEMNLVHGKGKLQVKSRKRDENIQISFQDDGPGISAENMRKLFRPFFTTRPVGTGTGLGLSVCYGIIAEHDGRIWAESEFGKGATFFIELPITRRRESAGEPGLKRKSLVKTLSGKVLVVDDEPTVREYLSQVLTEWGHQVDVAEDGHEALDMIRGSNYDAVLVDIKMPSMSGIELYRRLKKIDGETLAAKVIFVTGDVLEQETNAFISQSKIPLVTKPINLVDLNSKIATVLNSSRRRS
jgi:PAS domain S-box-containing protein